MEWIIFQSREIYLLNSIFKKVGCGEIGNNKRYFFSVSVHFPESLFPFHQQSENESSGSKQFQACTIDAGCFLPHRRSRGTKTGNVIASVSSVLRQATHNSRSLITHVGLVVLAGPLQATIIELEQNQSSQMKGLLSRVF